MIKTLRPDNEQYICEQVKAGNFATPEAVIDAAIDDMRESDALRGKSPNVESRNINDLEDDEVDDDLQASIDESRAQLDRGEGIDFDEFKAYWHKKLGGDGNAPTRHPAARLY